LDQGALSRVMCGLYGEFRELLEVERSVFKTTAIDHSAIPPRQNLA
jgi:hypothetical protein